MNVSTYNCRCCKCGKHCSFHFVPLLAIAVHPTPRNVLAQLVVVMPIMLYWMMYWSCSAVLCNMRWLCVERESTSGVNMSTVIGQGGRWDKTSPAEGHSLCQCSVVQSSRGTDAGKSLPGAIVATCVDGRDCSQFITVWRIITVQHH